MEPVCVCTIFFKPSRMKNQKLIIADPKCASPDLKALKSKQMDAFNYLLESDSFV